MNSIAKMRSEMALRLPATVIELRLVDMLNLCHAKPTVIVQKLQSRKGQRQVVMAASSCYCKETSKDVLGLGGSAVLKGRKIDFEV